MKKATPDQKSSLLLNSNDTSAATQRNQILAHLKTTPSINTLEFRELGFISPAPRILELKSHGHNIKSIREDVRTPDGRLHRGIARYYLSQTPPANDTNGEVAA
ncbi:MAG: helix-turn-helix domain-containing protein [Paraglaciecola sp.]|uniref:helix-turn-helix domain-containing protein n=1 Tax=Paraglaciecola sp. TaxID=1920173 RepID=UPI00329A287F